jgi:hypothetical protein
MSAPNWRFVTGILAAAFAITGVLPVSAAVATGAVPSGGTWAQAQSVTGVAGGGAIYPALNSVSCASPGNCSAIGRYPNAAEEYQPFVVNETHGVWGNSEEVPGFASLGAGYTEVGQVSCGSAGNCSAVGYYGYGDNPDRAFIADETSGLWASVQQVPGIGALTTTKGSATLAAVSCSSADDCAAAGNFDEGTGSDVSPFVVAETDGTWGNAEQVAGIEALAGGANATIDSISCASPGNCSAGGSFAGSTIPGAAFLVTETDGTWGTAELVPGLAGLDDALGGGVRTMSCASAGNCSAGGYYQQGAPGHGLQAFVVDETDGTWGDAEQVPGTAALNTGNNAQTISVSCASAGNCAAGGTYWTNPIGTQAFVVDETDGVWGTAEEVPGFSALNVGANATLNSVSCGAPGDCSAGGSYYSGGTQAFVASETDGTWAKAAEVPGSAVVNGGDNAAVESVSCPAAGYCSAGGYALPGGTTDIHAFVANEATASATTLALSRGRATYGDEALRATVTVSSAGGTPTGTAGVSAGDTELCTVTLSAGAGYCTLPAAALPAGTHQLTATYSGDSDFVASSSPSAAFTVGKTASTTRLSLSQAKVTYRRETAERLSVAVKAAYAGAPSGDVIVMAGKARICVVKLRSGTGTCALRSRQLKAATYHLTATYGGSADFAGSSSRPMMLMVVR